MSKPSIVDVSKDPGPRLVVHRPNLTDGLRDLKQMVDANPLRPAAHDQARVKPIAESKQMEQLLERASQFANSTATVLLTGESGTGKELIAHLIHQQSSRAGQPYVRINCAALAETLVESELFGHERGAFTGAVAARQGRLAAAATGTLLLDEISEIPPHLQAKLLRVLEEREFQTVGGNVINRLDARVIATSNRCLATETAAGRFREDLYYRLAVLELNVPPLRDRPDDIVALAHHFLQRFASEGTPPPQVISPSAIAALRDHWWPGNVRQLRNVIHRACVVAKSGTIQREDLEIKQANRQQQDFDHLANMRLEDLERHVILATLRLADGKKTVAAEKLGVNPRTLTNKLKRYRDLGHAVGEFLS